MGIFLGPIVSKWTNNLSLCAQTPNGFDGWASLKVTGLESEKVNQSTYALLWCAFIFNPQKLSLNACNKKYTALFKKLCFTESRVVYNWGVINYSYMSNWNIHHTFCQGHWLWIWWYNFVSVMSDLVVRPALSGPIHYLSCVISMETERRQIFKWHQH